MRKIIGLTLFLLLLSGPAVADQIVLKNGDRLSGKIVKADGDKLVMKTELVGDVTVALASVRNITSDQPLYVTLADGRTVSGVMTVSEAKAELRSSNSNSLSFDRSDIRVIRSEAEHVTYQRSLDPGWLDQWSGGADLGFALTSGNSDTTNFAMGLAMSRETRNDKTSIYLVTDVTRRIGWQLTLSDRYLSNPPFGFEKNDLILTTGLKIKLGELK